MSHASADKAYVEQIIAALDSALTFYDIRTISPGNATLDAMKAGVSNAGLFVLFHSTNSRSAWVDFEKSLAEVQAIVHPTTRILVCPLNGSDYKTLPPWMTRYMTTTSEFRPNDTVRSIQFLYAKYLKDAFPDQIKTFPGREALKREIALAVMRASASTGHIVSALVLTGVQGMGRGTLASELVTEVYRGMRPGGPIFEIPAAGDAVDWHLRFLEDLNGQLSEADTANQIKAFNELIPSAQADTLIASLEHWSALNQVVIVRHRWGLRDRGNVLRPWLSALFQKLKFKPNIRLILISERQLPREEMAQLQNVRQFGLEELDQETIAYILSERISPRYLDAQRLPELAKNIHGHPATANHVAYLVNSGRSIESLVASPEPVTAFQDRILAELFDSGVLSKLQRHILKLLCWFPKLSFQIIKDVFNDEIAGNLANELWELVEFSLVDQSDMGRYKVPAVVSSSYRRRSTDGDNEIFGRISLVLKTSFDEGTLDFGLIESLLVAVVSSGEELSDRLVSVLTPARVEPVIEREYYEAIGSVGEESRVHFKRCNALASLAMKMKTTDDSLENILFFGADSSIRLSEYPDDMIKLMKKKGFLTADYIEASYLYHQKRDFEGAARCLSRSLEASGFRLRNIRLLTRIYLRDGKFKLALDTLNKISHTRLLRDTGLVMMKVRALRGTRNHADAEDLVAHLKNRSDEYGDYAIYKASRFLREGQFREALKYVEQAKKAPKANKAVLNFLQCACEVESGNLENLASTCALARSMGREWDAWQLLARAALAERDWRSAEDYISRVPRKDWFDLNVVCRTLELKLTDPEIARDPVARSETLQKREEALRLSADAVEGSSYA